MQKFYAISGALFLAVIAMLFFSGHAANAQTVTMPTACDGITFERYLTVGMSGSDVKCLQAILNESTSTKVAMSGPGSLGNETDYFGYLTMGAVANFQEQNAAVILTPLGLTKGTGIVGVNTIAELNDILGVTQPEEAAPCEDTNFAANLFMGMSGGGVMCLQSMLNMASDTRVAISGPGSPGNETSYFGPLTAAAVINFQEKHSSAILAPLGLSQGTGYVGPYTRAVLNSMLSASSTGT